MCFGGAHIQSSMKTGLPQLSHAFMAEMNILFGNSQKYLAERKNGQEKFAQEKIGQEIIVLNVRNVIYVLIYVLIANIFSTVTCGFWSFFTKVSGC